MKRIETFLVPDGSGKALIVQKGHTVRISQPEGPELVDFNAFNIDNPRECLGSTRTRVREGIHVTVGNRLWSCAGWDRPMFTIIADTVKHEPSPSGARSHDFLFGRCSRKRRMERYGSDTPGCQEILAAAIEEFSLTPDYVHDPFNIFMKTGINEKWIPFWETSDAVKGDYVDLQAEMTCIVAISACPSGGPAENPVGFEVYSPE